MRTGMRWASACSDHQRMLARMHVCLVMRICKTWDRCVGKQTRAREGVGACMRELVYVRVTSTQRCIASSLSNCKQTRYQIAVNAYRHLQNPKSSVAILCTTRTYIMHDAHGVHHHITPCRHATPITPCLMSVCACLCLCVSHDLCWCVYPPRPIWPS